MRCSIKKPVRYRLPVVRLAVVMLVRIVSTAKIVLRMAAPVAFADEK